MASGSLKASLQDFDDVTTMVSKDDAVAVSNLVGIATHSSTDHLISIWASLVRFMEFRILARATLE